MTEVTGFSWLGSEAPLPPTRCDFLKNIGEGFFFVLVVLFEQNLLSFLIPNLIGQFLFQLTVTLIVQFSNMPRVNSFVSLSTVSSEFE